PVPWEARPLSGAPRAAGTGVPARDADGPARWPGLEAQALRRGHGAVHREEQPRAGERGGVDRRKVSRSDRLPAHALTSGPAAAGIRGVATKPAAFLGAGR